MRTVSLITNAAEYKTALEMHILFKEGKQIGDFKIQHMSLRRIIPAQGSDFGAYEMDMSLIHVPKQSFFKRLFERF